jgi:hypothetical protein
MGIAVQLESISQWHKRAIAACGPFIYPESRFRNLWVDDELSEAIQSACRWLDANPCPDESVGQHFHAMLYAYAHMKTATVARVMELREIIELHNKYVDGRTLPLDSDVSSNRTSPPESLKRLAGTVRSAMRLRVPPHHAPAADPKGKRRVSGHEGQFHPGVEGWGSASA